MNIAEIKNNLFIFNTMSGSKELFKPINKDKVLMYVCGITAYDYSHIGHARAYITFDIIYRYLRHIGFNTVYVRNFTDIDDKIIKKANEEGVAFNIISERFIDEFHKDMDTLYVESPSYEPKATETVEDMILFIKSLIDKGFAYEKNSDVFFKVNSFKEYGKLSHKNIDELLSGARIPLNEEKENPLDFSLWKRSKPNEPFWKSPWGSGRPGWHIECSAMSMKFLGEQIDIHGGGSDLIFPHHENEIAQSESFTGKKFVNYWIHNGFVNINNEKMSKSLKNYITIRDLLKDYEPEVIRLFFMFTHYRSFIDFSQNGLESAKQSLIRLYETLNLYIDIKNKIADKIIKKIDNYDKDSFVNKKTVNNNTDNNINISANYNFNNGINNIINNNNNINNINNKFNKSDFEMSNDNIEDYLNEFYNAMNDDFNTASALAVLFNLIRKTNQIINNSLAKGFIYDYELKFLDQFYNFVAIIQNIFGILKENPQIFLERYLRNSENIGLSNEEIQNYINKRNESRKNKDYKSADEIRKMLSDKGIILEDTGFETKYKIEN
ncbi:MAG: cysteine--tRNA ligase [Deltaproteobacteria bacterium]|nr:cysteine--tRNA ligase [Deltaproteobacteria bacterium]